MHTMHEAVKVHPLPPLGGQAVVERVHEPGLAAADAAPEVEAGLRDPRAPPQRGPRFPAKWKAFVATADLPPRSRRVALAVVRSGSQYELGDIDCAFYDAAPPAKKGQQRIDAFVGASKSRTAASCFRMDTSRAKPSRSSTRSLTRRRVSHADKAVARANSRKKWAAGEVGAAEQLLKRSPGLAAARKTAEAQYTGWRAKLLGSAVVSALVLVERGDAAVPAWVRNAAGAAVKSCAVDAGPGACGDYLAAPVYDYVVSTGPLGQARADGHARCHPGVVHVRRRLSET